MLNIASCDLEVSSVLEKKLSTKAQFELPINRLTTTISFSSLNFINILSLFVIKILCLILSSFTFFSWSTD